jgi:hypothetical protein
MLLQQWPHRMPLHMGAPSPTPMAHLLLPPLVVERVLVHVVDRQEGVRPGVLPSPGALPVSSNLTVHRRE